LRALGARHLDDLNGQVFAPEAVDEASRVDQAKLADNVVLHDGSCRGSERHDRCGTQRRKVLPQHAVIRPEVVAPLRNAVRLVNGDQRGLALGQHLGEAWHSKALRGDEHELQSPVQIVAAGLARSQAVEARVHARDSAAEVGELGRLVVHQGDQGADDQRRPAARQGGELIAKRLAGARRHHQQDVPAGNGGAAHRFLVGSEGREAERLFEKGEKRFDGRAGVRIHHEW